MKAILAASDLSHRSDRAVERALRLAADLGVPCHVICVVDDDQPDDIVTRHQIDADDRLRRFVTNVAKPGQKVFASAITGDPVVAILERAEVTGAGLLVLGMHRMRAFLDLLRETTMERLVRHSLRPVLLVHDPADHDYASVLAPVGFSPACAAALHMARQIAPDAEIRSFHAVLTPFPVLTGERHDGPMGRAVRAEAAAQRDAWIKAHDLHGTMAETEIIAGRLNEVMEHLIQEPPDLIAVGAHLRSGYVPHVLGSFVAELIRRPPCDVLIARGKRNDPAD